MSMQGKSSLNMNFMTFMNFMGFMNCNSVILFILEKNALKPSSNSNVVHKRKTNCVVQAGYTKSDSS